MFLASWLSVTSPALNGDLPTQISMGVRVICRSNQRITLLDARQQFTSAADPLSAQMNIVWKYQQDSGGFAD